jgi:hypothetical protein
LGIRINTDCPFFLVTVFSDFSRVSSIEICNEKVTVKTFSCVVWLLQILVTLRLSCILLCVLPPPVLNVLKAKAALGMPQGGYITVSHTPIPAKIIPYFICAKFI